MQYSIRPLAPFTDATGLLDLDELLKWVRVDESERVFINSLLLAAMGEAEGICNQPLFERDYQISIPRFVSARIPVLNLADDHAITATYIAEGSETPVEIQAGDLILRNGTLSFGSSLLGLPNVTRVKIVTKLGYPPDKVPTEIRLALRYMVNFYYDNRDNTMRTLPTVAESLLQPYKRYPV